MNNDIELYALKPDGKNAWCIVNEDNMEITKICDIDIEKICEDICNKDYIDECSAMGFIELVWEELQNNRFPEIDICTFCENWEKFGAWFNYLAVEYFTNELIITFEDRLLDFE